ncbi:MAG: hypothetical protein ACRAVC_21030 [Trichormus sp.]
MASVATQELLLIARIEICYVLPWGMGDGGWGIGHGPGEQGAGGRGRIPVPSPQSLRQATQNCRFHFGNGSPLSMKLVFANLRV